MWMRLMTIYVQKLVGLEYEKTRLIIPRPRMLLLEKFLYVIDKEHKKTVPMKKEISLLIMGQKLVGTYGENDYFRFGIWDLGVLN